MMRRFLTGQPGKILASAALCLALVGCEPTPSVSPEIQQARAKYLLKAAPSSPILITEARKLPAKSPMVIVGRLGVAGQPTWETGKAMFVVEDAHPTVASHSHGHGDDESDCVFCKRSKNERLAMVQIVGDDGEPLSLDAKSLLGVGEGHQVVIRGTGEVNSLDILVLSADGIFIQ